MIKVLEDSYVVLVTVSPGELSLWESRHCLCHLTWSVGPRTVKVGSGPYVGPAATGRNMEIMGHADRYIFSPI